MLWLHLQLQLPFRERPPLSCSPGLALDACLRSWAMDKAATVAYELYGAAGNAGMQVQLKLPSTLACNAGAAAVSHGLQSGCVFP